MTTGTIQIGDLQHPGRYFRKTWNGDNSPDGANSTTWNAYSVYVDRSLATAATYNSDNFFTPNFGVAIAWGPNDEIALMSKVADQARGHSFNLGVALGEGRETIDLVTTTCSRFYRSIKQLKRGNFASAARELGLDSRHKKDGHHSRGHNSLTADDISSEWLSMQYGFLPLLGDVHESAKAFSAIADKQRSTSFVVNHTKKSSRVVTGFCNVGTFDERISKRLIVTMTEAPGLRASLGLVDPYSVSWELIPFSFIADWFIPIGSYLDAYSLIPKLNTSWKSGTRITKLGTNVFVPNQTYWDNYFYQGANTTLHSLTYTRSSGSDLSVPFPEFHLDESLRGNRVWNSIALLHKVVRF